MATYTTERVIEVRHWSDKLFSFKTTRGAGLRFENGQFLMLGLDLGGSKIVRAYSIASANYEDTLEFYSIKVPQGPLTSRLQHIEPGSSLLISSKPTGTLVLRDVLPGRRLFLLATGTGVAPFLGIAKDPGTYDQFEQVILVRGARAVGDHAYADEVLASLRRDPDLADLVNDRLLDHPTVTREAFRGLDRVLRRLRRVGPGASRSTLPMARCVAPVRPHRHPAVGHPVKTRPRRHPAARHPDMGPALPLPESRCPDEADARRRERLDAHRRRCHIDGHTDRREARDRRGERSPRETDRNEQCPG